MQLTSRAGKAVKRGAMSFIDEVLPNCHVVERTGIESGGIKNTDIKIVPRVPFNQDPLMSKNPM